MKKMSTKLLGILAAICCVFCIGLISATAADAAVLDALTYTENNEEVPGAVVTPQAGRDGKTYLFLPATADYAALTFTYDETVYANVSLSANGASVGIANGAVADVTALLTAGATEHPMTLSADVSGVNQTAEVILMKSATIRTMYFTSDDPVNYGRPYVDASKDNEDCSGVVAIIAADGTVDYVGDVKELKGRGNTTFQFFDKKPYQIKLDKKAELVDGAGKSKKWILLANAADPTLIRNSLVFSASEYVGIDYTCAFESVDLYFDGEYRGTYLLTEKVEIGDGRIEISETDDLIEDANKDMPAYEDPSVKIVSRKDGTTLLSMNDAGSFRYVEGLVEPELPEDASHHAYLLEFELEIRYPDELTGFITDRNQRIVTKTPEYLTYEQGMYISNFWQEFEDAVYSPDGYNAETGKYYYDYCDFDSLVNCYVLNEFFKNCDYYESSTFFYLAEDSDKLVCGPLWDYDLAFGTGYDLDRESLVTKPEYFYSAAKPFAAALMKIDSFRNAVQEKMSADGEMQQLKELMCAQGGWIDTYTAEVSASQAMNYKLWDICNTDTPQMSQPAGTTFASATERLTSFVSARADWLTAETAQWTDDSYQILTKPLGEMVRDILQKILAFVRLFLEMLSGWTQVV